MMRAPDATWLPVVTAETTADELESAVARVVHWQLVGFVDKLVDGEWPPDVIARAMIVIRPLVEQQTRVALEAGVRRLRH